MAKKREEETTAVAEQQREFAPLQETWESFRRRHGDYVAVDGHETFRFGSETWTIIFEDGATARSTHRLNHGGQDRNPEDIVGNSRKILLYAEEKLQRELKAYDRYRADCAEQANLHLKAPLSCPPAPANMDEQLTAGEQRIDRWQQRCADLNATLDKLDPQRIAKRQRAEADAKTVEERQANYDRVMARLNQVPNIAPLQEADDTFTPAEETEQ